MSLLDAKVSDKVAEGASKQAEVTTFDSPDQVINQGTQRLMDGVGDITSGVIDQATGLAMPALAAGGAGFAGMKLFKGILEDDSPEL